MSIEQRVTMVWEISLIARINVNVAWDNVVDLVRIAVGINDCNDRNAQLACFCVIAFFSLRVSQLRTERPEAPSLNAAEVLELSDLGSWELDNFFFREQIEGAVSPHLLQRFRRAIRVRMVFEVGQHAAQPTCVNV